jgi:DNA (cytosine-5)-methyltransferase 3A
MSCGQIALREIGCAYGNYYASEIDRHCIGQTHLNFPDTIQLGNIEGWRDWDIDFASIYLILSGTPCTDLSFAGKMEGLDGKNSRLFWTFADILNHVKKLNPDVLFLVENVRRKKL